MIRGWKSVIVYPGDFLVRHQHTDEAGVVHELERELSGEAWDNGPVVLSWDAVREGARGESWGAAGRKYQLSPATYPGLDRLLDDVGRW